LEGTTLAVYSFGDVMDTLEKNTTVLCPNGEYATVISDDGKTTKVWKDGIFKEYPTKLLTRVSGR